MQKASFIAKCPFEIGDTIVVRADGAEDNTFEITDIACIHYVKSGTVQFCYEFNGSGKYTPIDAWKDGQNERKSANQKMQ